MKLETSIPPRRDGTVLVRFGNDILYTFAADADGALTCEVGDDAHVAVLLNTGNYYPADPESYKAAAALTAGDADEEDDDAGDADEEDDDAGDGMPVESNTPTKAGRKTTAE